MAEPTSCCVEPGGYCARVDTMFNCPACMCSTRLARRKASGGWTSVDGGIAHAETGCPSCGVIAVGHGRRLRRLHDIPAFGAPVELVWRQRRFRCIEPACPLGGFSEDHPLAPAQAKLTAARRGGRSAASSATTPRSPRSPAGSAWTGTPSGTRSNPCSPSWPRTQHG